MSFLTTRGEQTQTAHWCCHEHEAWYLQGSWGAAEKSRSQWSSTSLSRKQKRWIRARSCCWLRKHWSRENSETDCH
jgi:hypothetical protein